MGINLNISLPYVPCHILNLDVVDITGTHLVDVGGLVHKHNLDVYGQRKYSTKLFDNHADIPDQQKIFEEASAAFDAGEGCNIDGTVIINKVPGNFHISSHANDDAVRMMYMSGRAFDFSHVVHHLSFGIDYQQEQIEKLTGEKADRDMEDLVIEQKWLIGGYGNLVADYYLDVNQVDYVVKDNLHQEGSEYDQTQIMHGFKYRSTKAIRATMGMPAVFFRYEISPVKIRYTYQSKSLSEFLVSLCALLGGIFTVAGILEALLTSSTSKVAPKKAEVS